MRIADCESVPTIRNSKFQFAIPLSSGLPSEPKIDRLPDADKKSDDRAEQFNRLEMVLGYGKHQLFELCERIVRYFLPYETAHIKFGNCYRQTLTRRKCDSLNQC